MIVIYRVEALRGGFRVHVVGNTCCGAADGKTRGDAIAGAMALALRSIADALDDETLALADAMEIRFQGSSGSGPGTTPRGADDEHARVPSQEGIIEALAEWEREQKKCT